MRFNIALLLFVAGSFLSLPCLAQTKEPVTQTGSPVILRSIAPEVSAATKALREAGEVIINLQIDSQGNVADAIAVKGPIFARRDAMAAARQWVFAPADPSASLRSMTLRFYFKIVPRDVPANVIGMEFQSPYFIQVRYSISPREEITPANYDHKDELVDQRCKVHGIQLRKDFVKIVYGLLRYERGYERSQARLFPNDNTWIGGGCAVNTLVIEHEGWSEEIGPPQYGEVEYCLVCRQVAARWQKTHRPK